MNGNLKSFLYDSIIRTIGYLEESENIKRSEGVSEGMCVWVRVH